VRSCNGVDLVHQLEPENDTGRQGRLPPRLADTGPVVLDEPACLPRSANGRALLFHLIIQLYEKT
jgi:IstB-like ATP binding protein